MAAENLKARLHTELPELLKQDAGFRQWLEQLIQVGSAKPHKPKVA